MKKNDFFYLLLGVSYACFKATEPFIREPVETNFLYDVYLNSSFNDTDSEFDYYVEDNNKFSLKLKDYEVIDLLYRKDKIPIWIDIEVSKIEDVSLVFKLTCSGNYSKDRSLFYYDSRGSGPFAIKISGDEIS